MATPGTTTLQDLADEMQDALVADVGEDLTGNAMLVTLNAHNENMEEMAREWMTRGTNKSDGASGVDSFTMEELDEQALPHSEKWTSGAGQSYPLRRYGKGLQWSSLAKMKMSVRRLNEQMNAMLLADSRNFVLQMKRALYLPTNYNSTDIFDDHTVLPIKRLANADGALLPVLPDGTAVDGSTHNHYLGRIGGAWDAASLKALIQTVREHSRVGAVQVWMTKAEAEVAKLFTGFEAYGDPRLIYPTTDLRARRNLDMANPDNRAIGIFDDAEIWVKPYALSGYPLAINVGLEPPLRYRFDPVYGDGLQLLYSKDETPLDSRAYHRFFGIGVKNRTVAAIQYTGDTTYVAPTLVA